MGVMFGSTRKSSVERIVNRSLKEYVAKANSAEVVAEILAVGERLIQAQRAEIDSNTDSIAINRPLRTAVDRLADEYLRLPGSV
jgi:hypothetical protein